MAAVIRSARIDPERVLLDMRAPGQVAPSPATAGAGGTPGRQGAPAGGAAPAAATPVAGVRAAPAPAQGPSVAAPTTPATPVSAAATTPAALLQAASAATRAAPDAGPAGLSIPQLQDEWAVPALEAAVAEFAPTPAIDLEAEARAFRDRLAADREAVLAAARAEGRAEGEAVGRAGFDEGLETLAALFASLREVLAAEIGGVEDIIVDIAYEAVCRIVGDAVVNRDGAAHIVRELIQAVGEREKLLVRVAPADYEIVLRHRAQLLPGDDAGQGLEVVADERVALGGALVETAGGTLDGRLETQMQRLAETLLGARRISTEALG